MAVRYYPWFTLRSACATRSVKQVNNSLGNTLLLLAYSMHCLYYTKC